MRQEQKKESKREERRKGISPVDILLGHKVNSFMTVIVRKAMPLDGELSDSKI